MSTPESLPLRLTRRQRDLVVQESFLPEELELKLRFGQVEDDMLVFEFEPERLFELEQYVVDAANRMREPGMQREIGDVIVRIDKLLTIADPTGQSFPRAVSINLPAALQQALLEIMEEPEVTSLAEAEERLIQRLETEIRHQREDLAGLTTMQTVHLLESPWEGEDAAVRLNETLPFEDLAGVPMLKNARLLLQAFLNEGPVKATQAGNLTRKFTEAILDRLDLPEGVLEAERSVRKVINEPDFFHLHEPRVLLQMAKLVALRSSQFHVTKKGKSFLNEERAGVLFAELFRTLYRNMNLDYFDRMVEVPEIQETVAYSLYVIRQRADDWQRRTALASEIFLPYVKHRIPVGYDGRDNFDTFASTRVFHHLERFGLLERRKVSEPAEVLGYAIEYRKTPLYDRFIEFELPE